MSRNAPVARSDGEYVNLLNRVGTMQDNSTAYQYQGSGVIPDVILTEHYEGNGLFTKIIDTPAEEAVKHGFDLGLSDTEEETFITEMLDDLDADEILKQGIIWSRLYGGALGVMLIDDGRGIDEPLDWNNVKSIEEIRLYERSVVWPDYSIMYNHDNPTEAWNGTGAKYGAPEFYYVNSIFGQFWVHESRCLIFKNGILPERTLQSFYRFWGTPEYLKIKRELREWITSHSTAVKMLERSVQPIFGMRGLADAMMSTEGQRSVLERIQAVDKGRNLLNSIVIDGGDSDSGNESYEFKTFPLTGIREVLDSTCESLSAVTNIPQTILFGRAPTGMNATGESDLENYYNFIERIQRLMLKKNLKKLIDIIVKVGVTGGDLSEEPKIKLTFNPLWSMSEGEQADVDAKKASTEKTKADTAKVYVDMGSLDPLEVRKGLAQEGEFHIEELLEALGADIDIWGGEDMTTEPLANNAAPLVSNETTLLDNKNPLLDNNNIGGDDSRATGGVGVIVLKNGKVLCGIRSDNGSIGGPGGHIEQGETPAQAAMRETKEEFGITPKSLLPLGLLEGLDSEHGKPHIFLCTDFHGKPKCADGEISVPMWVKPDVDFNGLHIFQPFAESLRHVARLLRHDADDQPRDENGRFSETDGGGSVASELPKNHANETSQINTPTKLLANEANGGNMVAGSAEGSEAGNENMEAGNNTVDPSANVGTVENPSALGSNPDLPGFSQANLDDHWVGGKSDHSKEYSDFTKEQYAQRAHELVRSATNDTVLGYKIANGAVVRFDKNTGDFVKGFTDTGIATMFKLRGGEGRFSRIMSREGGLQYD